MYKVTLKYDYIRKLDFNFVIYRKGEQIYLSDTDPFFNIIKKQQEIFTIEKL